MIGLFEENGPCRVDENGEVYNNPYSWSNASNMLCKYNFRIPLLSPLLTSIADIDHPAQVGFSYSKPVNGYTDPSRYVKFHHFSIGSH